MSKEVSATFIEKIKKFREPVKAGDIEWKIQTINQFKGTAMVLPYVRKSACVNRLEAIFGPLNWRNFMSRGGGDAGKGGTLCTIDIRAEYEDGTEEWISKTDAGADSAFDAFKGAASDSFKRASKMWGYGRELDSYPTVYIELDPNPNHDPKDRNSRKFYESIGKKIYPQLNAIAEKKSDGESVDDYYKLSNK